MYYLFNVHLSDQYMRTGLRVFTIIVFVIRAFIWMFRLFVCSYFLLLTAFDAQATLAHILMSTNCLLLKFFPNT